MSGLSSETREQLWEEIGKIQRHAKPGEGIASSLAMALSDLKDNLKHLGNCLETLDGTVQGIVTHQGKQDEKLLFLPSSVMPPYPEQLKFEPDLPLPDRLKISGTAHDKYWVSADLYNEAVALLRQIYGKD